MIRLFIVLALLSTDALAREETMQEMNARLRLWCLDQPRQYQEECNKRVTAHVNLERARRNAERAARRSLR